MKNFLIKILSLCIIISTALFIGTGCVEKSVTDEQGLIYTLNEDRQSYTLTGIDTLKDVFIIIPSHIKDKPVTHIGEGVFKRCVNIMSVTIPNSVISIGKTAFFYCRDLTSIEIPDSVKTIGAEAFGSCINLRDVQIGDGVETIGKSAFFLCESLTTITIPNNVTDIEDWAFACCDNLTSAKIGVNVTNIGQCVFSSCNKLGSVIFSDTSTWHRVESYVYWDEESKNDAEIDVTNPSRNATYFKSTYKDFYWYKI